MSMNEWMLITVPSFYQVLLEIEDFLAYLVNLGT
jgi:hypothetical protein